MSAEDRTDRAEALLAKVQQFIETLDAGERELFAVLIGPGIEALYTEEEVSGFSQPAAWEVGSLRAQLAAAAEASGMRVVYRTD